MSTVASLRIAIGADAGGLSAGLSQAADRVAAFGDRLQNAGRRLSTFVTVPLVGLGTASVLAAGRMESMQLALKAVMGSSDAAAAELEKLRQVAENPGLGFEQVVGASLQLQNVGMSADRARELIAGLGNAIALSGGTAGDFGEVSRQLSQIASLGRVTAENLNVILERSPAMAQALQNAFGTTSAEAIRSLGLSSEEFLSRLMTGLAALPKAEGGIMNDLSNAADNLKVSLVPLGQTISEIVLPPVLKVTEWAARLSAGFAGLDNGTRRLVVTLGMAAAAAGPLLIGLGSLLKLAPLLKAGFFALVGPIGLTIALIGSFAAAGYILYTQWEEVQLRLQRLWQRIVEGVAWAIGASLNVIADLGEGAGKLLGPFGAKLTEGANLARGMAAGLMGVAEAAGAQADALSGSIGALLGTRDAATAAIPSMEDVQDLIDKILNPPGDPKPKLDAIGQAMKALREEAAYLPVALQAGLVTPIDAANGRVSALRQAMEAVARAGGADTTVFAGLQLQLQQAETDARQLNAQLLTSAAYIARLQSTPVDYNAVPTVRGRQLRDVARTETGTVESPLDKINAEIARLEAATAPAQAAIEARLNSIRQLGQDISGALAGAFIEGITVIGEGIGNLIAGTGSIGDIGRNLLKVFADLMTKLGGLLIAFGVAGMMFGNPLTFLIAPWKAIAAGALLVAAGAAIKGVLSRGAAGGAGSGGGTFMGGGRPAMVNPNAGAGIGTDTLGAAGNQTLELAAVTLSSGDTRFSVKKADKHAYRQGTADY